MNKLTAEQQAHICCLIDDWYSYWKYKIISWNNKTHQLGYAKEMLKVMIVKDMYAEQSLENQALKAMEEIKKQEVENEI